MSTDSGTVSSNTPGSTLSSPSVSSLLNIQVFDCDVGAATDFNTVALKTVCRENDNVFQELRRNTQKIKGAVELVTPTIMLTASAFPAAAVNTAAEAAKVFLKLWHNGRTLPDLSKAPESSKRAIIKTLSSPIPRKANSSTISQPNNTDEGFIEALEELSLPAYTKVFAPYCSKSLLLLIACDPDRVLLMSVFAYHIQCGVGMNIKKKQDVCAWPSAEVVQLPDLYNPLSYTTLPAVTDVGISAVKNLFTTNPQFHPFIGKYQDVDTYVAAYNSRGRRHARGLKTFVTQDFFNVKNEIGDPTELAHTTAHIIAARAGPNEISTEFKDSATLVSKKLMPQTWREGSDEWVSLANSKMTEVWNEVLQKDVHALVVGVACAIAVWGLQQFSDFTEAQRHLYWFSLWDVCPYFVATTVEASFLPYVDFNGIFDKKAEIDRDDRYKWRAWFLHKFIWNCEVVYQYYVKEARFQKANDTLKSKLCSFFECCCDVIPYLQELGFEDVTFFDVPVKADGWKGKKDKYIAQGPERDDSAAVWQAFREPR